MWVTQLGEGSQRGQRGPIQETWLQIHPYGRSWAPGRMWNALTSLLALILYLHSQDRTLNAHYLLHPPGPLEHQRQ